MSQASERTYRRYLDALNERRFGDLEDLLHEELTYNGEGLGRGDYVAQRREEASRIPDLHYAIDLLVVEADQVACRIAFDCAPRGEFLGIQVNAQRITFVEHVFYRFRDGRIADVWSLIDTTSIKEQLGAEP